MHNKIHQGDCIEVMKTMQDNSIDAIVTDPPYGIGFMGKEWDRFEPQRIKKDTEYYNTRKVIKPEVRKSRLSMISSAAAQAGSYDTSITGARGYQQWCNEWSIEALRVLKPGGFMLVSCSTRMYHRMTCGIEDAGFEIRDTIMWLYGSGFPKSLNIGKQIDKMGAKDVSWFGKWLREWREKNNISQREIAKLFPSKNGGLTGCVANWELGLNIPTPEQFTKICRTFDLPFESIEEAEREIIGKTEQTYPDNHMNASNFAEGKTTRSQQEITAPATPEAKEWEGWGTALKPACEPIVVARKPLSGKNVALNVLKWGTGGINIDACRISLQGEKQPIGSAKRVFKSNQYTNEKIYGDNKKTPEQGRFPANIILDETIELPEGNQRFFYIAKASGSERNEGLDDFEERNSGRYEFRQDGSLDGKIPKSKNNHPTVKPINLMEYLIKLVTRENAIVLDPFMGSGTTAIACRKLSRKFIGIEKEAEYIKIAEARLKPYLEQKKLFEVVR